MIQSSENQTSKNQKNTKNTVPYCQKYTPTDCFFLPTGIIYTVDVIDGGFIESIICVRIGKKNALVCHISICMISTKNMKTLVGHTTVIS